MLKSPHPVTYPIVVRQVPPYAMLLSTQGSSAAMSNHCLITVTMSFFIAVCRGHVLILNRVSAVNLVRARLISVMFLDLANLAGASGRHSSTAFHFQGLLFINQLLNGVSADLVHAVRQGCLPTQPVAILTPRFVHFGGVKLLGQLLV